MLGHGESTWNAENRFTGWVDANLTDRGELEARAAGALMVNHGIVPDIVHTSVLTRSVRSAVVAVDEMGLSWLPVKRSWQLNERHYGTAKGSTERSERKLWARESRGLASQLR